VRAGRIRKLQQQLNDPAFVLGTMEAIPPLMPQGRNGCSIARQGFARGQ
jgi:hypothetical protein